MGWTAKWRAAGLIGDGVTMAVNVAIHQLADPGFVSIVVDALEAVELSPEALCIELTESTASS